MTTTDLDIAELAASAAEAPMLDAFLDYHRDAVVRKVRGVSEEDARRRLVPSMTTLGGMLKHLYWVELNWFQAVLDQQDRASLPTPPWTDEDPDADFRMTGDETVDGLIAEYEAIHAKSREIAARHALDERVPHRRLGQVTMRWILVHMIEETARHAGHVDILRELVDGTVGD